jgi:hypothetical protein
MQRNVLLEPDTAQHLEAPLNLFLLVGRKEVTQVFEDLPAPPSKFGVGWVLRTQSLARKAPMQALPLWQIPACCPHSVDLFDIQVWISACKCAAEFNAAPGGLHAWKPLIKRP